MKYIEPRVLKPKNIENVGKFLQELLESQDINEIGAVKVKNRNTEIES